MKSSTRTYEVRINNIQVNVEAAADNPRVSPKQLLSASGNHPGSYALFADEYSDAEDVPALFDERRGERLNLDSSVDVSEHQRFIAVLKRHL